MAQKEKPSTNNRYSTGQIAAARLLVKREREGKMTVPGSQRIHDIANSGKGSTVF